jgi:hypothetical protein
MSFLINSYRFGAAPPAFLLDTYTGAAAAYSLRQLRTGVTNVVRVRRSTDNAEADFTAVQIAAEADVAWVGAGNDGFIVTLYDQSTNGRHKTEGVSSFQPWIVINGVAVKRNGIRSYYGNGNTRGRLRAIFTNTNTGDTPYSAFTVGENLEFSASLLPFGLMPGSAVVDRRTLLHVARDSATEKSIRLSGGNNIFSTTESGVLIEAVTYNGGAGQFQLMINGVSKAFVSGSNAGLNIQADSAFIFGCGNVGSAFGQDYNIGPQCEAYGTTDVYYFTNQAANAAAITTILNNLHGVY